jgi:hypothetical protein
MTTHRIPRTANQPVVFEGELVAHVSGAKKNVARWHELALYCQDNGLLILHIAFRSNWEKEAPVNIVSTHTDLDEVVFHLRGYDPSDDPRGWPPGPKWEARQEALERLTAIEFDELISQLLLAVPDAGEAP